MSGPRGAAVPGPAAVLVTRLAGRQRVFPAGGRGRVRVGRGDPATGEELGITRLPVGLDIAMLIGMPNGVAVTVPDGGLPQATVTASSGCFGYQLTAGQLGRPALPAGPTGYSCSRARTWPRSARRPISPSAPRRLAHSHGAPAQQRSWEGRK